MQRGAVVALCALLAWAPAMRALAAANVLTGAQVVGLGAQGDGSVVTLEGEAIGDILRADRAHVWINVLSGGTAVGAYIPRDLTGDVKTLGDYKATGDTVHVTGVFNFACDQHGGELDIHASEFRVVSAGSSTEHPLHPAKLAVAAVLAAGLGLQVALHARSRRREP